MKYNIWFIMLILTVSCGQQETDKKAAALEGSHEGHQGHGKETIGSAAYVRKVNSGEIKQDTLKGSPKMVAMANVGSAHVHITYSSPGVKDRMIWGGLVPYEQVWVTGAHTATSVNVNEGFTVGGKNIPAGTYAIFTIPGKEKWTVILNRNYTQHLTDDYDAAQDVVRMEVTPQVAPSTPRLMYSVAETDAHNGVISVQWEKIRIDIPITINASK